MEFHFIISLIVTLSSYGLPDKTFSGNLKHHTNQEVTLTGFNYYESYILSKDTIDSKGYFNLMYPKDYKGMAILTTQDNNSLVVSLTEPNIILNGTHLRERDSINFLNSFENNQLIDLANRYNLNSNIYKAWRYLQPIYKNNELLHQQQEVLGLVEQELRRIETVDKEIIDELPKESYLRWFAPLRNLINDMPKTVFNYNERISQNIQQFREIDFNNPKFKTSGLLKELIEGHYMLIENMGQPLDSVASQMNLSTDYLIKNLEGNKALLNNIANQLFNYFEKRSMFNASKHLAGSMLSKNQCDLTDGLINKFEAYRKLKVGNTAPEIIFPDSTKLSNYNKNTLLVFGASWCPSCKEDAWKLLNYFDGWKSKGLEIIYISMDSNKELFQTAYKDAPWQTYCDYKGWESQAVKDYHITGTPSYFLLDKEQKILVKPISLEQVDTWLKYKM
ncbi:thioredoxin family protein [Flavivirga sp. 57AJ16]|uniref:TlpA family protein disulfide reductase n=1 Tax=Flavivirga sp. 57AJ16 TaxID=3025307 RepID=UPI002366E03B|nr:thioredoxin family protein [Flavivirga sp. 57AJ16]MDD7886277.1 thioredoxin family protein [Flavivirga sp. 57AJ16]